MLEFTKNELELIEKIKEIFLSDDDIIEKYDLYNNEEDRIFNENLTKEFNKNVLENMVFEKIKNEYGEEVIQFRYDDIVYDLINYEDESYIERLIEVVEANNFGLEFYNSSIIEIRYLNNKYTI